MAASLNTALSLPLLNTASSKEYVDLAVRLFHTGEAARGRVRAQIRRGLGRGGVLFNSERFAGQLERVYQAVYELYPSFKHVYHVE